VLLRVLTFKEGAVGGLVRGSACLPTRPPSTPAYVSIRQQHTSAYVSSIPVDANAACLRGRRANTSVYLLYWYKSTNTDVPAFAAAAFSSFRRRSSFSNPAFSRLPQHLRQYLYFCASKASNLSTCFSAYGAATCWCSVLLYQ
jgi:hypothetical protein